MSPKVISRGAEFRGRWIACTIAVLVLATAGRAKQGEPLVPVGSMVEVVIPWLIQRAIGSIILGAIVAWIWVGVRRFRIGLKTHSRKTRS